jgi:hypothetical protein
MQENQNAFQNAGQHGFSEYISVGNQSSTFLVLLLSFILLIALLKSEARYRELIKSLFESNHAPVNYH